MTKLDITNVPRELDVLIKTARTVRHAQILEVVRRHYLLELCGRIEELVTPDMMVDSPVYYLDLDGASTTLRGQAEVLGFYKQQLGVVFACEETSHAVSDAGYWMECRFNFYLPGSAVGRDPDGWFRKRQWITMHWPFDARARVAGERVYEHVDIAEIVPIDRADVITPAEARAILEPLIRPLPVYAES